MFAAGDGVASRDQEIIQWPTPRLTDTGSRFSITNISTNSKPKSKLLES
jgi:hypothetical protein